MSKETPTRNLALDLARVTESAALSAARWLGKGDKEAGDGAAVDAMRISFQSMEIRGTVVIGEGEKDEAPMLYNGEVVGTGNGPEMDIAVDPVEGTRLLAYGRPNAIATVAMAPRGSMFDPKPAFYMAKLAVPEAAKNVVDMDAPVADNLQKIAKALGKDVEDLTIFVLEKKRHEQLIADIRKAGARIQLQTDGDVFGALMAVNPGTDIDVLMGTGGSPEAVLAAAAVKTVGGELLVKYDPQSEEERKALEAAGVDMNRVLGVNELITSEDVFFAATGISEGTFLRGVQFTGKGAVTHTMVMRGKTGTVRYVESHHRFDKLMEISAINYDVEHE